MIHRHTTWLAAAVLLCAACSGPRDTTDTSDPLPVSQEPINMAAYEDFDPSPYEDAPSVQTNTVEHDVPESLLEGKVNGGSDRRTGTGYRIQIYSSQDKQAADRQAERAVVWWREQLRSGRLDDIYLDELSPPPVYQDFRQPYYRVRLGNFASRAEAQKLLRMTEQRFPRAFIVPDKVTLNR